MIFVTKGPLSAFSSGVNGRDDSRPELPKQRASSITNHIFVHRFELAADHSKPLALGRTLIDILRRA